MTQVFGIRDLALLQALELIAILVDALEAHEYDPAVAAVLPIARAWLETQETEGGEG